MGVRDADAEAEGPHPSGIEDAIPEGLEDEGDVHVVAGVELLEIGEVVAAAGPTHVLEVHAVMDSEVLEGAEEALLSPSERSGVAVSPSSSLGWRCSSSRR